jgi:hypothetical protein
MILKPKYPPNTMLDVWSKHSRRLKDIHNTKHIHDGILLKRKFLSMELKALDAQTIIKRSYNTCNQDHSLKLYVLL